RTAAPWPSIMRWRTPSPAVTRHGRARPCACHWAIFPPTSSAPGTRHEPPSVGNFGGDERDVLSHHRHHLQLLGRGSARHDRRIALELGRGGYRLFPLGGRRRLHNKHPRQPDPPLGR